MFRLRCGTWPCSIFGLFQHSGVNQNHSLPAWDEKFVLGLLPLSGSALISQRIEKPPPKRTGVGSIPTKGTPMTRKEYHRAYRQKLRLRFFEEYGKICVCCGETELKFLTIHHKDGSGAQHRRELFPNKHPAGSCGGTKFYAKILKQGEKDPNLETLCFNCNTAIQFWGACPHQDNSGR